MSCFSFREVNYGLLSAEGYSEPTQSSEMKLFSEIVDDIKPWIILTKRSILNVGRGFEYASNSKHADKEYRNTIDIVNVLCWVSFWMFPFSTKEPTAWICFFLTVFYFKTKKDLVLVKFYRNAAGRRFLKTFGKFAEKRL